MIAWEREIKILSQLSFSTLAKLFNAIHVALLANRFLTKRGHLSHFDNL